MATLMSIEKVTVLEVCADCAIHEQMMVRHFRGSRARTDATACPKFPLGPIYPNSQIPCGRS